jgi:hypothetical protein
MPEQIARAYGLAGRPRPQRLAGAPDFEPDADVGDAIFFAYQLAGIEAPDVAPDVAGPAILKRAEHVGIVPDDRLAGFGPGYAGIGLYAGHASNLRHRALESTGYRLVRISTGGAGRVAEENKTLTRSNKSGGARPMSIRLRDEDGGKGVAQ